VRTAASSVGSSSSPRSAFSSCASFSSSSCLPAACASCFAGTRCTTGQSLPQSMLWYMHANSVEPRVQCQRLGRRPANWSFCVPHSQARERITAAAKRRGDALSVCTPAWRLCGGAWRHTPRRSCSTGARCGAARCAAALSCRPCAPSTRSPAQ